jgi:TfoX/Sxy family transcriptional regulator of competence genes
MAYDQHLATRVHALLPPDLAVAERKMFGGLAYMVHGNMAAGIVGDSLMVRVGPDAYDNALAQPHTRPMDFNGRPMRGMVYIDSPAIAAEAGLQAWLQRGLDFALSLPPK